MEIDKIDWNLGCTFLVMVFTGLTAYFQYVQFKPVFFLRFLYPRGPVLYFELVIQNNSKSPIHICGIMPKKPFSVKISPCDFVSKYIPGKGILEHKKPKHESLDVDIFVGPGKTEIYEIFLSFEDEFLIEPTTLIISLRILANSLTEKHKIIDVKSIIPKLTESSIEPSFTKISPV
jgi:hypothetical protein